MLSQSPCLCFFFNDTATTEIYTLSLHDALPISISRDPARSSPSGVACRRPRVGSPRTTTPRRPRSAESSFWASRHRSEEHTSELQSHVNLVCRLLLEKKKKKKKITQN